MAKVRTQADRRQNATVTDQHGRKYHVVIEKDTMHPCSEPTPKNFNPPLLYGKRPFLPPQAYQAYAADDPFAMKIDYDGWLAFTQAEHEAYDEKLSASAVMMFGSGAADAIKRLDPELLRYVGRRPTPIEPIMAARQGNQFALGLNPRMPNWAIPFFTAPVVVEEIFEDVFEDAPEAPTDIDGFEASVADEQQFEGQITDEMLDLEEETDKDAVGGHRVDPRSARNGGKGKVKKEPVKAGR